MYRRILIGVDGSPFALKAARHGLGLAKALSAEATALIVTPTWSSIALSEIAVGHFEHEWDRRSAEYAETCLSKVREIAAGLGTACETTHAKSAHPYAAILAAARDRRCDLVVVGSHGRRGIESIVLGSEASKLLVHSHLPVLVYRE